jgi:hypothetical protein
MMAAREIDAHIDKQASTACLQQAARDARKVWAMVMAYGEYYYGEHTRWMANDYGESYIYLPLRSKINELVMQAPLVNPATGATSRTFYLRGICDSVVEIGRSTYLYEMKTTSDSMNEAVKWLKQSMQIPAYQYMLRKSHNIETVGAVVDIVKKPVIKQRRTGKNAETIEQYAERCRQAYLAEPARYFRREILPYDELAESDTLGLFWRTAQAIRQSDKHGYAAVQGARCKGAYGWCGARELCWYHDTDGYAFGVADRYEEAKNG